MRKSSEDLKLILSDKLISALKTISSSRTMPACVIQRSKIFLLAAEGLLNKDIASKVNLHVNNVGKWRSRFTKEADRLNQLCINDSEEFNQELMLVLRDKPRSGAPFTYTPDQRAFIVTVACQEPEEHGFELSHWNLSALRLAVIAKGIVQDISAASINRILNENEVRPHKNQYWLHSTDKEDDPEVYKAKVKAVNEAYAMARELADSPEENSVRILSTDEMTGIQALEHKYPDKPVKPGMTSKSEFEYIRHGTVSLSAFFDVATGKVEQPYLSNTRTESDFFSAIR